MADSNGVKVGMVIFGIITAILVPAMFFMGGNVIANDNKNTVAHTEITSEMIRRDERMMDSLHEFDVRQEVLIETVDRIDKKL